MCQLESDTTRRHGPDNQCSLMCAAQVVAFANCSAAVGEYDCCAQECALRRAHPVQGRCHLVVCRESAMIHT